MEKRLKKILRGVAEIGQLVDQTKENVSAIEIDIILEKIRGLYLDVRKLEVTPAEKAPDPQPKQAEAEVPGHFEEDAHTPAKEMPEPVEEIPEPVEEVPEPVENVPEPPEAEAMSKAKPEILADRYKDEKRYINETLSRNDNKQDLTAKLQSKPITNIHSSLGINDRFKLINTLFNGDKESYENAITTLNDAANFNDAFTYINSSFDWDMEDESVQMLLDLVRRKFIVNQDE